MTLFISSSTDCGVPGLVSGHVLRLAMQQLVVTEIRAGTEARWGRVMRRDGDNHEEQHA